MNILYRQSIYRPIRTFSTSLSMSQFIKSTQKNTLLVVELDRPKALNALTLDMCQEIKNLLSTKINAPVKSVGAFLVKGSGEKAFCAGGDIKSIWKDLDDFQKSATNPKDLGTGKPGHLHTDFFRQEYIMNYLLGTSGMPQISIWNGIVMGGGVGVSVLGEFRIATENSTFAMPENVIGLFPDVGSSAWLPHLKEGFGNYIGLIGDRLNAADLIYSGIATHFINKEHLPALESELAKGIPFDPVESRKHIKAILDVFQSKSTKPDVSLSNLAKNESIIQKCFGDENKSVHDILENLAKEKINSEWASKTLETFEKLCPTSVKLTFATLQKGKSLDLQECLKMEFRVMMRCMSSPNFKEGTRALLIEKDNTPKWQPNTLDQVSDELVNSYFEPLGEYELNLF